MPLSTRSTTIPKRPSKAEAVEWRKALDRDRSSPPPTRPSLCSRFRTRIDSLIDHFQPRPSSYEPTHTRRTYRRAQDKIRRFGTWCKNHITPSKTSSTTSIGSSHESNPDDERLPDLLGSQVPIPNGSRPPLTKKFSFEENPGLALAPVFVLNRKTLPPKSYGQGRSRHPFNKLSGTTAAGSVNTRDASISAITRDLSYKARLLKSDSGSISSMLVGYHIDENADGGVRVVNSEKSTAYKGSVPSRESLSCNESMDHKESDGTSGILSLPPLELDLGLDFGFESGGKWSSQPAAIVV